MKLIYFCFFMFALCFATYDNHKLASDLVLLYDSSLDYLKDFWLFLNAFFDHFIDYLINFFSRDSSFYVEYRGVPMEVQSNYFLDTLIGFIAVLLGSFFVFILFRGLDK